MSTPMSRTANSARNAGVSVLSQIVVIILGFATRTVFVTQLGVALLGVNTLLTSIVAMLAFADLGINGALMHALYKPLKEGDQKKVAAIVRYAGRLFRWVALAVTVVGLAITPFIHRFVRLEAHDLQLEIYYLVLLTNTVISYLMLNRLVLLNADQKIYLTKMYSLVFNVLRSVAQIISILVLESFLVFLIIQVIFTWFNNVAVYFRAGKLYPYIKKSSLPLDEVDRHSILISVRALIIFRVGGLILNNSPALLISITVGTAALGYYSNYMLIVASAVMITEVLISSFTPSVGNLVTGGDKDSARRVFDEMVLFSILLHGFIATGIFILIDEFVTIWLSEEFLLAPGVVAVIVLNFYVTGTLLPLWSFRNATGLFRQTQWVMLLTALLSVLIALTLGPPFGLVGVVAAPALARLVTGAWYEPLVLIRSHLSGKLTPYFLLQAGALILWVTIVTVIETIATLISGGLLVSVFFKLTALAVLFPFLSWLAFRRVDSFWPLVRRVQTIIQNSSKSPGGPTPG